MRACSQSRRFSQIALARHGGGALRVLLSCADPRAAATLCTVGAATSTARHAGARLVARATAHICRFVHESSLKITIARGRPWDSGPPGAHRGRGGADERGSRPSGPEQGIPIHLKGYRTRWMELPRAHACYRRRLRLQTQAAPRSWFQRGQLARDSCVRQTVFGLPRAAPTLAMSRVPAPLERAPPICPG